ncbi:MAG: SMP-30/gluconolactonase/LRE family protein [Flavobacteriaceae bacterium]|nr:SMP-30/gluconolactonase/LRE family protein [Flavobacteriaceae bacterium]
MKYLTLLFFSFCFYTLWAQDAPQVLEILDPRMEILISKNAKIEILAEGFGWAEGPVWIPELNGILFSDVPNNKAYLWTEKKGLSLFLYPSGMTNHAPNNKSAGSNGLGLDSDGNLILCQHGDRSISRLNNWFFEEPKYDVLVDHFNGKWLNSPNDLVFDKQGSIYFTDPPYGLRNGDEDDLKELNFNGVFKWSAREEVKLVEKNMSRPNGIALSLDEKTAYVANSDPANDVIMAFDVLEDGFLNGRIFFDGNILSQTREGLFDGLKMHSSGIIFATGPGGVLLLDSLGVHLGTIMPGKKTANCSFDKDEQYLYLTSTDVLARIKLN